MHMVMHMVMQAKRRLNSFNDDSGDSDGNDNCEQESSVTMPDVDLSYTCGLKVTGEASHQATKRLHCIHCGMHPVL